jgi:hypothetical protein
MLLMRRLAIRSVVLEGEVAPSEKPGGPGQSLHDESGSQPGESYLDRRNSIGSAVGGAGTPRSSGERWEGGRDPTALCETWLVTELCDRWDAAAAFVGFAQ